MLGYNVKKVVFKLVDEFLSLDKCFITSENIVRQRGRSEATEGVAGHHISPGSTFYEICFLIIGASGSRGFHKP